MLNVDHRTEPAPGGAARERVEGEVKFLVCVDRRPQSRVAVRFACRRARNLGGRVSLLHVVEPPEFQHWTAVGDVIEGERREDAERLLLDLAAEVVDWTDIVPELIVREGEIGEEILAQASEDSTVNFLVVGAAAPTDKSFSLITFLAGKLLGHLSVPLIVIPGNLTDEEIIALT
ncbi:MAG: universal stress protein [Alphaproteobacteria bacterium]